MPNIYLLHGSERILIDEWITHFINKNLPDGKEDLNYSAFDLDETPIQTVIQQAETIPFMGDNRVIIATSANFFGTTSNKQFHNLDALSDFILDPPSFSKVIFKTNTDKLDKRKKITKHLEKQRAIISFDQLNGRQLEDWIKNRAKQYACEIEYDALQQLIVTTGSNMTMLANEISKMCLYVGKRAITREDIDLLVPRSLEQSMFSFVDKLVQRNIQQGLQIIYDLLKNKEQPIVIFSIIVKRFRTMLMVKELVGKGYSQQHIASQIGQHPYVVKISSEQARAFNDRELRKIIISLAEADEQIKSGKLSAVLCLEKVILSLAR